jgi:hypothetical protein
MSLQNRRKRNDIIFLKKVLCGDVDDSLTLSKININVPARRLRKRKNFRVSNCKVDVYKNSFTPRAQNLCNELQLDIFFDPYYKIKKYLMRC